jgi:hypothetical protein
MESFFKDKLAHNKIAMRYYLFSNAVCSYFWSNIATWWEGVSQPILQGKPNASHMCARIKLHTHDRQ